MPTLMQMMLVPMVGMVARMMMVWVRVHCLCL
jgi:hypothetical protein